MTKNNSDEWNYDVPLLGPHGHTDAEGYQEMQRIRLAYTAYVRRDRLMLARPIAAFPKHWAERQPAKILGHRNSVLG